MRATKQTDPQSSKSSTPSSDGREEKDTREVYLKLRLKEIQARLQSEFEARAERDLASEAHRELIKGVFRHMEREFNEWNSLRLSYRHLQENIDALIHHPAFKLAERAIKDDPALIGRDDLPSALLEAFAELPEETVAPEADSLDPREPGIRLASGERLVPLKLRKQTISVPARNNATSIWARVVSSASVDVVGLELELTQGTDDFARFIEPTAPTDARDLETARGHCVSLEAGVPTRLIETTSPGRSTHLSVMQIAGKRSMLLLAAGAPTEPPPLLLDKVRPAAGRVYSQAVEIARLGNKSRALEFAQGNVSGDERPSLPLFEATLNTDNEPFWLKQVNAYVCEFGLEPLVLRQGNDPRFVRLHAQTPRSIKTGPLISVILCAHNAEATLEFAVHSILHQTWQPLELIIVDDGSTDSTPTLIRKLADGDSRIKVHRNPVNLGADVSRNCALPYVTGRYLTCHDADDWAHPERLERHIRAMLDEGESCVATRACRLRMSADGRFTRFERKSEGSIDGALEPAMVSCLFDTAFFRQSLGHWDCVWNGGDAELFRRVEKLTARPMRTFPDLHLFMLDDERTVSRHPVHGSRSAVGVSPSILDYRQHYRTWHETVSGKNARLPFPHRRGSRRFPAPVSLVVPDHFLDIGLGLAPPPGGSMSDPDVEFLQYRVDGAEDLLAQEFQVRADHDRDIRQGEAGHRKLFDLQDTVQREVRRALKGEARLRRQLRDLQNSEAQRLWNRMAPTDAQADEPKSRSSRPGEADPPTVLAEEPPSSSRILGTEGLLLRLKERSLTVSVPPSDQPRTVWARLVATTPEGQIGLDLKVLSGASRESVAKIAGHADPDTPDSWRRSLKAHSGQSLPLLELSPDRTRVDFKFQQTAGKAALIELKVQAHRSSGGNGNPFERRLKVKHKAGRTLVLAQELERAGRGEESLKFARKHADPIERPAVHLLEANLCIDDEEPWLHHLNRYLRQFSLSPIELAPEGDSRFLRLSSQPQNLVENGPLVSVIMCAYNAERTLEHAARSILNQSWRPLELIIVDDASTDATVPIARKIAQRDSRVRLHCNGVNVGCDVTKSIGALKATGDYITSHDSDDWAHPQRIERHLQAMCSAGPEVRASRACMLRMTPEGMFRQWTSIGRDSPDGVLRYAMITTLFETSFFRKHLGAWDSVRFGADSEMVFRLKQVFPDQFRDFPLFGLLMLDVESSESYNAWYGSYSLSPSDSIYRKSYRAWHQALDAGKTRLPLPHLYRNRNFHAPSTIVVPDHLVRQALRGVE